MPSAGVGCALSREALAALAREQHGSPFDPGSLTEDYEIGLRITERGGRSVFVHMRDDKGELVCTREHFPESLEAAVKQKARWMVGISLAGWDRLGWQGGVAERWMRLRDRRGALAALILFAAYVGALGYAALAVAHFMLGGQVPPVPGLLQLLLAFNAALFLWRAMFRFAFVTRAYGWRQGLMSVPRTFAANIVAILAARRAMAAYVRLLRGHPLIWEKTQHRFPDALESGA